jgi:hypothetical protein
MIFEHLPTIIFSISLSTLPNQIKMKQENHIYITKTMLCLEVSFFMIIVIGWSRKISISFLIQMQKFPPKKWKSIYKTIARIRCQKHFDKLLLLILPKVRKLACVLAVCSFIYASGKKLI